MVLVHKAWIRSFSWFLNSSTMSYNPSMMQPMRITVTQPISQFQTPLLLYYCIEDKQTCDCERSILGTLAAWSHLLVWRDNIEVLLNMDATWLSRSDGMAIARFLAATPNQAARQHSKNVTALTLVR